MMNIGSNRFNTDELWQIEIEYENVVLFYVK